MKVIYSLSSPSSTLTDIQGTTGVKKSIIYLSCKLTIHPSVLYQRTLRNNDDQSTSYSHFHLHSGLLLYDKTKTPKKITFFHNA